LLEGNTVSWDCNGECPLAGGAYDQEQYIVQCYGAAQHAQPYSFHGIPWWLRIGLGHCGNIDREHMRPDG